MTDYMYVMLSSMSGQDQRTYSSYPEAFGQCAFSGQIGTCKVVPTDGPTKENNTQEAEFAAQIQEMLTALKSMNKIPAATTAQQLLQAVIGRSLDGSLTDPTMYEEAEEDHPTAEDAGATSAELAAALVAAMPPVPGQGQN